jgi:hypothetical protein
MEGNKYVHEVISTVFICMNFWVQFLVYKHESTVCIFKVPGKDGGLPERKEVLLEDHDPVWLELRHAHIADVGPAFMLYLS